MHSELLFRSVKQVVASELHEGDGCRTGKSRSQNARAEDNASPDSEGECNAERSIGMSP